MDKYIRCYCINIYNRWQYSINGVNWINILDATASTFTIGDLEIVNIIRVLAYYINLEDNSDIKNLGKIDFLTRFINQYDDELEKHNYLLKNSAKFILYRLKIAEFITKLYFVKSSGELLTLLGRENLDIYENGVFEAAHDLLNYLQLDFVIFK